MITPAQIGNQVRDQTAAEDAYAGLAETKRMLEKLGSVEMLDESPQEGYCVSTIPLVTSIIAGGAMMLLRIFS